jgi:hypothetical protein
MGQPITNLQVNGLNPAVVGGTGTTVKYFPFVPGASINVASTKNGYVFIPGNGEANGQVLNVRVGGNFTIGTPGSGVASPAVTVGLYSATFLNGNPGSTATINSTAILSQQWAGSSDVLPPYGFSLDAQISCESGSGLARMSWGHTEIDGTAVVVAGGLISGLTGINMSNPVPFALLVGVTFSVSDAQASANLYQFDLEQ